MSECHLSMRILLVLVDTQIRDNIKKITPPRNKVQLHVLNITIDMTVIHLQKYSFELKII